MSELKRFRCRQCGKELKMNDNIDTLIISKKATPYCDAILFCAQKCLSAWIRERRYFERVLTKHSLEAERHDATLQSILYVISEKFWENAKVDRHEFYVQLTTDDIERNLNR